MGPRKTLQSSTVRGRGPPTTSYQAGKGSATAHSGHARARPCGLEAGKQPERGADTEVPGMSVSGTQGLTWEVRTCHWP